MSNKIGFTLDEAEVLRRIVGKKKVEEVKKWQEKIKDKIKENNLAPEIGDILWFCALLAKELGYDLADIGRMNLEKLRDRQERGVLKGNGDKR